MWDAPRTPPVSPPWNRAQVSVLREPGGRRGSPQPRVPVAATHLHAGLRQLQAQSQLLPAEQRTVSRRTAPETRGPPPGPPAPLPGEHVGVVRLAEGALQLLQLEGAEGGSVPPLLPLQGRRRLAAPRRLAARPPASLGRRRFLRGVGPRRALLACGGEKRAVSAAGRLRRDGTIAPRPSPCRPAAGPRPRMPSMK